MTTTVQHYALHDETLVYGIGTNRKSAILDAAEMTNEPADEYVDLMLSPISDEIVARIRDGEVEIKPLGIVPTRTQIDEYRGAVE